MKYSVLIFVSHVSVGLSRSVLQSYNVTTTNSPLVDLGYSQYLGSTTFDGRVNEFIGVRFAAPPLGDLRWRAPADPLETDGIQNATAVCHLATYLIVYMLT
jgi:hypothetical protein